MNETGTKATGSRALVKTQWQTTADETDYQLTLTTCHINQQQITHSCCNLQALQGQDGKNKNKLNNMMRIN